MSTLTIVAIALDRLANNVLVVEDDEVVLQCLLGEFSESSRVGCFFVCLSVT